MSDFQNILYLVLRICFIFIIPAFIIYFRIKKKITTGFAIGGVITSLLLSLFTYSAKTEPLKNFYKSINNNDYVKAKKAFKIVIQHGTEYLEKLDENNIYNKKLYHSIRQDVLTEYDVIIKKIVMAAKLNETSDCNAIAQNKLVIQKLEHAQLLISFSESIGGAHKTIKQKIKTMIHNGEKKIAHDEKKCHIGSR